MTKRPSLFATPAASRANAEISMEADPAPDTSTTDESRNGKRPPSRAGKRVLSVYLDPLAWKQLRQLALDSETTTQALGEEAINLLFAKHGLNRSA
jgi:hypothetical protein